MPIASVEKAVKSISDYVTKLNRLQAELSEASIRRDRLLAAVDTVTSITMHFDMGGRGGNVSLTIDGEGAEERKLRASIAQACVHLLDAKVQYNMDEISETAGKLYNG